jgi:chorismate mutase
MENLNKKTNRILIAGPCSAENEEQIMQTAIELSKNKNLTLFRAGIWKPRTRPGFFEGVGSEGLKWLKNIKNELGLECTTEVGNAKHVEEALNHDIKNLWIGARTTVNPFAISEIAEALKGTNANIMIKNPINADLELWIGAVERIQAVGIKNISLIHRGFSSVNKTKYSNVPLWEVAMKMRSLFPDLPLICDPSHIAGKVSLLDEVILHALHLNYDGLMIETHIEPEKALSDKLQQITPIDLENRLKSINNIFISNNLNEVSYIREDIDLIDDNFLYLLGKRMELVTQIGKIKANSNQEVIQEGRWKLILDRLTNEGSKKGVSPQLIEHIFNTIHSHSINTQLSLRKQ